MQQPITPALEPNSTLSYIATKASERGIDLAVLTGGADPKTAIPSRDIPYRKLNKELIQVAVKLSVLAIQKEDQSAAMGDDASDDAFELYLASISAMLHALPCATTILFSPDETCDAFRRETFESQLYGFLNSELENISEEYLSDTSHSKQHRHQRRRRHREQHHRATALIRHHTVATNQPINDQHLYVQRQDRKLRREQHTKQQRKLKKAVQAQQLPIQAQGHKYKYGRPFQHFNMASPVLSPTQASCLGSKCSCHRHQSHHTFSFPTLEFDNQTKTSSNHSPPGSVSGSGISDTIISTAVHSAIRLKQSPIPDAVKTCLRTSKNILHKVDERFHLQEKAWKLSKQSIEKAVELDEQYAIHRLVTETVFATLTGLVKAGIAYKETPSYGTTRVTDIKVTENPNAVRVTSPQRRRHVYEQRRSKTRQYWAKSQGRDEPGLFAANASGKKGRGALSAVTNSGHRPNFEARWEASFSDSGDSDSDIATASISSSRISSCTSSDDDETTEEDEKLLDFKQQTLLSFDLSRASPILSSVTPPCSEQVREKIDMMMALKGAASLIAGYLCDK
ncbi:hypothetical protein BGZ98_008762 [Dissophora globulifera]|nr:hypothetical protein BGZ98_008762 [Dissophora globulifera]